MKFNVTYQENKMTKTIIFEAADSNTVRDAVSQWVFNEKRIKGRDLTIININEIKPV